MTLPSVTADHTLGNLPDEILKRYSTHGPRYTSYPTAPVWTDAFNEEAFQKAVVETNTANTATKPLSLYMHLLFCESRCLFCSCNVIITPQREQAEIYLGYLFQEIDRMAAFLQPNRPVLQYHWGGGTPTYLSVSQMTRLFEYTQKRFTFDPQAEIAIEVDPRVTTDEQLHCLKHLGFNRISMGVQDFEPVVQEAVHRIQPIALTEKMLETCRELGFSGINFDLIYGLPHQTEASFENTLNELIRLAPDRIALYNYAYVPWISAHQKQIEESTLPDGAVKFRIFKQAIQRLMDAGYEYIGMDHFAKPTDELAIARREGTLHRNFMGFTTKRGCELYGFGVSAISGLDRYHAQNVKKLSDYYRMIEAGKLPVHRGIALTDEDVLRRTIIQQILCQGTLDAPALTETFGASFTDAFADALPALSAMEADGLLNLSADGLALTPLGRVLSRNVAMVFDAYLNTQQQVPSPKASPLFSKTV